MLPIFHDWLLFLHFSLLEILIGQIYRINKPLDGLKFSFFLFLRLLLFEYPRHLCILQLPLLVNIVIDGLSEGEHEQPGDLIMKFVVFGEHLNLGLVLLGLIEPLEALLLLIIREHIIAPTIPLIFYMISAGLW